MQIVNVLDALAASGVKVLVVQFSGGGDEGEVNRITVYMHDGQEFDYPVVEYLTAHIKQGVLQQTAELPQLHNDMVRFLYSVTRVVYEQLGDGWYDGPEDIEGYVFFEVAAKKVTMLYECRRDESIDPDNCDFFDDFVFELQLGDDFSNFYCTDDYVTTVELWRQDVHPKQDGQLIPDHAADAVWAAYRDWL